jgi:hypothetical protein
MVGGIGVRTAAAGLALSIAGCSAILGVTDVTPRDDGGSDDGAAEASGDSRDAPESDVANANDGGGACFSATGCPGSQVCCGNETTFAAMCVDECPAGDFQLCQQTSDCMTPGEVCVPSPINSVSVCEVLDSSTSTSKPAWACGSYGVSGSATNGESCACGHGSQPSLYVATCDETRTGADVGVVHRLCCAFTASDFCSCVDTSATVCANSGITVSECTTPPAVLGDSE